MKFLEILFLCFTSWITFAAEYPVSTAHAVVYHWDRGLGHLAVGFQKEGFDEVLVYISYACGNNLKSDIESYGPPNSMLALPNVDLIWEDFFSWYQTSSYYFCATLEPQIYNSHYSLLRHNCVHAVLRALQKFGYNIPKPLLPFPSTAFNKMSRMEGIFDPHQAIRKKLVNALSQHWLDGHNSGITNGQIASDAEDMCQSILLHAFYKFELSPINYIILEKKVALLLAFLSQADKRITGEIIIDKF